MKKLALISLFFLSIFLFGCGSKTKLDPDNPVTLNMWHVYGNQTISPMNDAVDEFNRTEGKKQGVYVKVMSVLDSTHIDNFLQASLDKTPGAAPLPDLFTAYPRVHSKFKNEQLLAWDDYLSKDELALYNEDFLKEAIHDKHVYSLPIAKSTETVYLNKTFFDRYAAARGISTKNLEDFDTLFATCRDYYQWSGGENMFHINDIYNYMLVNMASLDDSFVQNNQLNLASPNFKRIYLPLAKAAIAGGLSVYKGYASDGWKTGVIISGLGSSAALMYHRDYVTHADNTRENIQIVVQPYPHFNGGKKVYMQRGVNLTMVKSSDERKNLGAIAFAKWFNSPEHNITFCKVAGYLPVYKESIKEILAHPEDIPDQKFARLFIAFSKMPTNGAFIATPLFPGSGTLQHKFENTIKGILAETHKQYLASGANSEELLDSLAEESLQKLQASF